MSIKDPESDLQDTQLSVIYHSLGQDIADGGSQANSAESQARSQPQAATNNESREDRAKSQPRSRSDTSLATNEDFNLDNADFADLDDIPEQLQQPLREIAALGVLTPYTGEANVDLSKFAPNKIITRGEYARWLIAANNRYYSDNPGKKIYIASKTGPVSI